MASAALPDIATIIEGFDRAGYVADEELVAQVVRFVQALRHRKLSNLLKTQPFINLYAP